MLVLSRRLNEELVIDGNIRITVLAIKGTQVRLGITAPSSVNVLRGELLAPQAEVIVDVSAAS
jgi:carbon storage regulator